MSKRFFDTPAVILSVSEESRSLVTTLHDRLEMTTRRQYD